MDINICFALNNQYAQHCGVVITSILKNSNPKDKYNIYLITDNISEQNKDNFEALKSIRDFNLEILTINTDEFKGLNVANNLGESQFYSFKAFDLIKADKFLYLDCDVIVRKDIAELYKIDLEDFYIAGVEDIVSKILIQRYNLSDSTTYINSGVMLVNSKLCKKDKIYEKIMQFVQIPWEQKYGDQDIINKIFENRIKPVDLTWNCMYMFQNTYSDQGYYHETAKDPAIVHYITNAKPWAPATDCYMKLEYFQYLKLTPWYEDFMIVYNYTENLIFNQRLTKLENTLNNLMRNL